MLRNALWEVAVVEDLQGIELDVKEVVAVVHSQAEVVVVEAVAGLFFVALKHFGGALEPFGVGGGALCGTFRGGGSANAGCALQIGGSLMHAAALCLEVTTRTAGGLGYLVGLGVAGCGAGGCLIGKGGVGSGTGCSLANVKPASHEPPAFHLSSCH